MCRSCNNGLAHLDQAVIDDFDMAAFLANVPRKGGRPPVVKGRGNLVATRGRCGLEISINMDPVTNVAHDGSALGAFGRSRRNVKASLVRNRNTVRVSYSTPIGQNPKFVRGITKIAFSSFAYFQGPEIALQEQFSPVRAFVRNGIGKRPVLMMFGEDTRYSNRAWPPYESETGEYTITFRLAAAEFLVDLSPTLSLSILFEKKLAEVCDEKSWTWMGST